MNGRAPTLFLALTTLAALSGCMTAEVWRGYAWPDPVVVDQHASAQTRALAGTLTPAESVLEDGLCWCGEQENGTERWWLGPQLGAETGEEVVAALLADPELCEVRFAAIDAQRGNLEEHVFSDDARLDLHVRLHAGAMGEVVPAENVSRAAAHVLATSRRNAYVLSDAGAGLPAVFRRCAARVPCVDLRTLVGERNEVHAEAWVFVDRHGRPAADDAAALPLPAAAHDETTPLADRLAALRELSLLVCVRHGDDTTILRLRPDRLWLASGLHGDGEHFTHVSSWHLQSRPLHAAAAPAAGGPHVPSSLRLRQDRYERSVHPVWFDHGLLTRILATPVTLAVDIVLGPGAHDLWHEITGKPRATRDRPRQRN